MKRWICIVLSVGCVTVSEAQVKWDGEGGDGSWGTATNWVGDLVPGPGDHVVLDNSVITGNYTVSLPAGNISIIVASLIITPAPATTVMLTNPTTNTSPSGFLANGPGDAIVINNGGIILNASGAASGTPVSVTSTNFLRINNGGRYIHRTGRQHTDFLVSRLSNAAGTEQGMFEFDVPGTAAYTISGSGRTYGQLILSAQASGGSKTYATSGIMPLQLNGDLLIRSNATLSYGANINVITVKGDLIINTGGVFNLSNGGNNATILLKGNLVNNGLITESGTSVNTRLEFSGTTAQNISGTGTLAQSVAVSINNQQGITLLSPFTIPYRLQFLLGKMNSSLLNSLIVNDNATCSGSSGQSFVDGPLSKIGDDDFVFPVGKGSIYAPVAITGSGGAITDRFTAEYIRANPQSTAGLGAVVAPPLHHVSYVEYWNLVREVGTSVKTVGLTVTAQSFAKTLSTLSTAQYSAGVWQDRGVASIVTGPPAPPYATGSFTTASALNDFGSFTIGATDDGMTNPLPLQLMSFTVTATPNDRTMIQWEIAPSADSAVFEIERGDDGRQFNAIMVMQKQLNIVRYAYEDPHPLPGINYYRLKIRNGNSDTQYSRIGIAQYNRTIVKLTTATPFITTDQSLFILESPVTMQSELLLLDMMGNVRTRKRQLLAPGKTSVHLPTANLAAGIYIVYAVTARGNTQVVRCVKL